MKINYLFIIVAIIFVSCKEGTKQDSVSTETTKSEVVTKAAEPSKTVLTQNGDYSSLFNSEDCHVITAEEISTATGVSFSEMDPESLCNFISEASNTRKWYLSIKRDNMRDGEIDREIQNFVSDETGQLNYKMSETGDTYLCIQHSHGYLSMYNPNYNGSVLIRYGSIGESRGFSKEERETHKELSVKLANALLTKHKR